MNGTEDHAGILPESERDARINAVIERALDLRQDERREVIATLIFFEWVMRAKASGPT